MSAPEPELDSLVVVDSVVSDPELRAVLESMGRTMAKRAQEEQAQTPEPERPAPATAIQFPLFPEETRPVTNDVARSALFSCVQGKDRQMVKDVLIATVDGVEIRFTGERFNQDDHDLLMQLVFMAKHKPLGEYATIPARAILKALGRKTGGDQHRQLRADILRLFAAAVSLRNTNLKVEYFGHLIDDAAQDEASRYWAYRFNPKLRTLYDPSMYTLVEWEQRKKLRGKDLARWLHLNIISHAAPFPYSVAKLHELSGSRAKALKNFRAQLRIALDDLIAQGAIEAWEIDDNDLVHIYRGKVISDSQRRHLTGKPAKKRKRKP